MLRETPTTDVRREPRTDLYDSEWIVCLALTMLTVLAVVAALALSPAVLEALTR
jgi:hypothetical protein